MAAEKVLATIAQVNRPLSVRELARELNLHGRAIGFLGKTLGNLKRKSLIREIPGGRYVVQDSRPIAEVARHAVAAPSPPAPQKRTGALTGRLVAHRDGYGFVVPEQPVPGMDGDLFIPPDALGDAMHGDRVEALIARWSRSDRAGHASADQRAEGRILRVLARAHPTVVGIFRYDDRGNVVLPYESRLHHEIIIPPGDELPPSLREKLRLAPHEKSPRRLRLPELDGSVVNVELIRFPKGGVAPSGRVVEILGKPGDLGVDIEIIIRKHHLLYKFPEEVLEAARATPQHVLDSDLHGREDFRHLPIVTIDGETAKDFDDAVHVARLPGDNFELQVHIADVAHYVRRDSPLDREARLRGTSVYFPDRAVPMLPEDLSNNICSLNPNLDRLVMSCIMTLDSQGEIIAQRLTVGVIRSVERMTYTNVNKVIESDPEMSARYAPLVENFRLMKELALILNAKRTRRGAIDFDLPERLIEFDSLGRMVTITRSERNIAHRLIEEFMLAANETVDRWLESRGIHSLHRVHEKPDPKRVLEFDELAHAFGYSLGVETATERRIPIRHGHVKPQRKGARERPLTVTLPDEVDIRPQHYQRLTEKIAGKPEERILSYLMLRSLKQARYAPEPLGHFALAVKEYTHFTSPIRRYPDLIVHRILKWVLQHADNLEGALGVRPDSSRPPYSLTELKSIADESSEAERRAATAERELVDWKTAQFMESRLGEEYDALVISVQKFGFFVELMEIFVEGLVPVSSLELSTGERFLYREREHALVTSRPPRRAFRLGDRIRVRADRIDPIRRRVEFAVV